MKVLMVHPSLQIVGGLPAYVAGLVEFLRTRPEIRLEHLDETKVKGYATIVNAQPVHRLISGSARLFREFSRRLEGFRPDVVHLHSAHGKSLLEKTAMAWLASRKGVRVVLHLHGPDLREEITGRGALLGAWYRRIWSRQGVCVVVLARTTEQFLRDRMPAANIVRLANGVRIHPSPTEPRCAPVRVGFLGVLNGFKGEEDLVEAISRTVSRNFEALMAGDGPTRHSVGRRILDLGLEGRVKLLGTIRGAEKDDFFDQIDLLCLPSRTDNLPLAVLEAMARARPVVASRIGGIPELVEDGVTGWLVDAGDVTGLARALDEAVDNAVEVRRRGQLGWEKARRDHDWQANGRGILALYQGDQPAEA